MESGEKRRTRTIELTAMNAHSATRPTRSRARVGFGTPTSALPAHPAHDRGLACVAHVAVRLRVPAVQLARAGFDLDLLLHGQPPVGEREGRAPFLHALPREVHARVIARRSDGRAREVVEERREALL